MSTSTSHAWLDFPGRWDSCPVDDTSEKDRRHLNVFQYVAVAEAIGLKLVC
jgi:hypothetical protein